MFGNGHIERRRTDGNATLLGADAGEPTGKPDRNARQSAVTNDEIRAGTDHLNRHIVRQVVEELSEILGVGGTNEHLRLSAHAKPGERRQWCIELHAPADRREQIG
jgi:hypothetical protein